MSRINAVDLYPRAILFWWRLGKFLAASNQVDEAIAILERGLSLAGLDDWEQTLQARVLLAQLYEQLGQRDLAALQYCLVLQRSYWNDLREQAERFLQGFNEEPIGRLMRGPLGSRSATM